MYSWERAGIKKDTIVMEDLNLDFNEGEQK